jgi:DNA repair protein RAD16
MMALKGKVLDSLLLRRVKSNFTNEMLLPPKIVVIRRDLFDEKEDDFYQAIYTKSTAQFNAYVTQGTLLNNYAHIFDLLIRLRQAVDHPYLVLHSKTGDEEGGGGDEKGSETMICGICHEDIDHLSVSKCHHTFCLSCIREYISSKMEDADLTCPTCYAPLSVDISGQTNTARIGRRNILSRVSLANFTSSTKIEALMEEVHRMLEKDPCSKGIVFSQFVNMLDIIEYRLQKGGIKVVKLTGGMTVTARDRVISAFKEDPAVTIFLVSLKAGGVALNLTVASNVFLMDPWWNPAAEYQAIDRAHRLGQFKTIRATRFIIENSIEDRILALQEKKRLVFEGTIGGDNSALGKLTVEDLQFLFQN